MLSHPSIAIHVETRAVEERLGLHRNTTSIKRRSERRKVIEPLVNQWLTFARSAYALTTRQRRNRAIVV